MTDTAIPDPGSGPQKDAELVQRMFDRVAPRYDLANTLLALGQDRHWRRVAARALAPRPGQKMLDVAAGTGMLAHELRSYGADVVALDFSANMLRAGADREARGRTPAGTGPHPSDGLRWCTGDGTRLPFGDGTFDGVTIAFGLRNLPDVDAGLAEFSRVLRPGGQLLVLEFSRPTWATLRFLYQRGALAAMPLAARICTSDPRAYRYLAESIVAWPDQRRLAAMIAGHRFAQIRWKNLSGGIVAAHHAIRTTSSH